jgi:ribosomal protein S18 acetylase RimI-like enzyme
MRLRPAVAADATALGHLMVESWLAAHRGQMPDVLWQKRSVEWTPDVSANAWARVLAAQEEAEARDDVLLVAEDEREAMVGVLYGIALADAAADPIGEVAALYVASDRQGEGVGAALLRAGAARLQRLGATRLRVSVLTANRRARGFYEVMGGLEAGSGTTDEAGTQLPTTIYEWSDVSVLAGS